MNCEKYGLILTEIDSLCKKTFQFLDRPNIASIQKNMNITLTEFFLMFRQENKSTLLENVNKSEFLLFVIYVAVKSLIYQQNLLDC